MGYSPRRRAPSLTPWRLTCCLVLTAEELVLSLKVSETEGGEGGGSSDPPLEERRQGCGERTLLFEELKEQTEQKLSVWWG